MKTSIAIVDYGMGNLRSVAQALKKAAQAPSSTDVSSHGSVRVRLRVNVYDHVVPIAAVDVREGSLGTCSSSGVHARIPIAGSKTSTHPERRGDSGSSSRANTSGTT